MKFSVDDQELFTLSPTQKLVIQNDIAAEDFDADMRRRVRWVILDEKYNKCFERLKKEWDEKLASRGVEALPVNKDAYANLVFSQPDYKSRSVRNAEERAALAAAEAARAVPSEPVSPPAEPVEGEV